MNNANINNKDIVDIVGIFSNNVAMNSKFRDGYWDA